MTAADLLAFATAPRGYAAVVRLAKQLKQPIPDLLALSRNNDPFFSRSPAHHEEAEWFVALWQRFGYTTGVHLRRVHYQVFVQRDVRLPDGQLYENTKTHWYYLQSASRHARYLGLVSADALIDQRNPAPHVHVTSRAQPEPAAWIDEPYFSLPAIGTRLSDRVYAQLPEVRVTGYDYDLADQPYHVEVWAEKSTMDDVLLPVCRALGVNLVTSAGFQSITGAVNLLRRAAGSGKPVRIFYISDFDHAGWHMPPQVARQIEFWLPDYLDEAEADIKLTPLVLTRDQVDAYQLPNAPGEMKTGNVIFEAQQGRGVVELDALEALRPGELATIVRDAILRYQDEHVAERLAETRAEALAEATAAWEATIEPRREEIRQIVIAGVAITARYEQRLTALNTEMQAELAPLQARLESVRRAIQESAEEFAVELPERDAPDEHREDDDRTWLYDCARDYGTQLAAYKHRGAAGEAEESD